MVVYTQSDSITASVLTANRNISPPDYPATSAFLALLCWATRWYEACQCTWSAPILIPLHARPHHCIHNDTTARKSSSSPLPIFKGTHLSKKHSNSCPHRSHHASFARRDTHITSSHLQADTRSCPHRSHQASFARENTQVTSAHPQVDTQSCPQQQRKCCPLLLVS